MQTILTSHSTQIASQVSLKSIISLTKREDAAVSAGNLATNASLDDDEIADLERFLDATKSNLLFARKVMLVEGSAELFLIPALFEKVEGIDLEREGISLVAIHGTHFEVYSKLFCAGGLEKRCAIVADADLDPLASQFLDARAGKPELIGLKSDYVEIFLGDTTFERELVSVDTLPMFIETVKYFDAPQILGKLEDGLRRLEHENLSDEDEQTLLIELGTSVLNTAKRFGKARFAQVAARYADKATEIPDYIQDAYDWLTR